MYDFPEHNCFDNVKSLGYLVVISKSFFLQLWTQFLTIFMFSQLAWCLTGKCLTINWITKEHQKFKRPGLELQASPQNLIT